MRLRRMGVKTRHSRKDADLVSQELLFQSSQLRRHAAGVYGFGNILTKARNNVVSLIRRFLDSYGCAEVSLPVMQPKSLWLASGRWDTYSSSKQMYSFLGRTGEYCLAPTGEEIVLDFVKDFIISYKDLPINIYQIGNKYRDEIRVRGGIFRSKEFLMKDGYSFHATFDDMVHEYESMRECYFKIFSALGLDVVAVEACNSNMGGKVSHEFMCVAPTGEDKILVSSDSSLVFNEEVLEDEVVLDKLRAEYGSLDISKFRKVNAIELGHIFQLGTFYSERMGGVFIDEFGAEKNYYMGCYGIGVNRLLGAICEVNYDEQGLVWPVVVAPYVCALVCAPGNLESGEEVYSYLKANGVSVVFFDKDATFGENMKDAKLLGFPYVVIVGRRFVESKVLELECRRTGEKHFISMNEVVGFFSNCGG